MDKLEPRVQLAFGMSRKLNNYQASEAQRSNIAFRLRQIFTDGELEGMDDKQFVRQVERVWPIAQYVDRK